MKEDDDRVDGYSSLCVERADGKNTWPDGVKPEEGNMLSQDSLLENLAFQELSNTDDVQVVQMTMMTHSVSIQSASLNATNKTGTANCWLS